MSSPAMTSAEFRTRIEVLRARPLYRNSEAALLMVEECERRYGVMSDAAIHYLIVAECCAGILDEDDARRQDPWVHPHVRVVDAGATDVAW